MTAKELVKRFYKSDAFINSEEMKTFLHPDIILEWNTTNGIIEMNFDSIIKITNEMSRAYIRTKVRISHLIAENDLVSVRYSHFVKTIENPREEMLLAHSMIIWQIKDNQLFRGYQMSQYC